MCITKAIFKRKKTLRTTLQLEQIIKVFSIYQLKIKKKKKFLNLATARASALKTYDSLYLSRKKEELVMKHF